MASLYRAESRRDPAEASIENLAKARASKNYHPPRPWRSKEESEMVLRYAFWWYTSRDPNKPSCRDWARQLGISHTWLQKLIRKFEENPGEMWCLQRELGDPTLVQLSQARECTQDLRRTGGLHPRRRSKSPDETY